MRSAAVVALVALGVVAAACSSGDGASASGDSETSPASTSGPSATNRSSTTPEETDSTTTDPTDLAGGPYVALGSSFAAGGGIPTIDPSSGSCLRADRNYPRLVAERLDLPLVDVSCGGATTDNILRTPQGDHPVQIDAVTADATLVTVTIGGNNLRYAVDTFACAASGRENRSCLDGLVDPLATLAAVDALPAEMAMVFGAIRSAAPSARIVLVGYPRVLPEDGRPCPPSVPLLAGDADVIAATGRALQEVFVSSAAAAGVDFVDVYAASAGHDACAEPAQRWVEGANPESPAGPFHPNLAGFEAMADLIVARLMSGDG